MGSVSYFEIGGQVIESEHATASNPRPRLATAKRPDVESLGVALAGQAVSDYQGKENYDPARAMKAAGRARRARWAFGIAATLAIADGPLPIGDAIAIAGLTIYGGGELIYAAHDVLQPDR